MHHDDFCHNFLDCIELLDQSDGLALRNALIGHVRGGALPELLACAFTNWSTIADELEALLAHAPMEALFDDVAQLSFAAREMAQHWVQDMQKAVRVVEGANAMLVHIAARDARSIEAATCEMRELMSRIGAFIVPEDSDTPLPDEEIEDQVELFLADIRALHVAWGNLPGRLHATAGA